MTHKLSPNAFRVWDSQERRYVEKDCETSETAQAFILAHQGWLATIQRKGGAKPADPERYTVERFTGMYDGRRTEEFPEGQPIFEGDVLQRGSMTFRVFWFNEQLRFLAHEDMRVDEWLFPLCNSQWGLSKVVSTIHDWHETSSK